MNANVNFYKTNLNGKGLKVAIAVAEFNTTVTESLLSGAVSKLEALGVLAQDISVAWGI